MAAVEREKSGEEQAYLRDRLQDQIKWYSAKSSWNQKWFKLLRLVEIVCAVSIPFFVAYSEAVVEFKLVSGVLGVMVALISGVLVLYKFQDNWISYRTTCESLKREQQFYLAGCEPYDAADRFCVLVKRVESLLAKENTAWEGYTRKIPSTTETGEPEKK